MILSDKKQVGFTLIELIIYIAIVSVILVSISYLMLELLGGGVKNKANEEVNQNVRVIVDYLVTDIRSANNIDTVTADTLVLSTSGDDITYNFVNANSGLTRQVGAGLPIEIHSDEVEVIGSFSDLSFLSRSKNVGVHFNVSYKNPSGSVNYNSSTTVDFSVELRGRR